MKNPVKNALLICLLIIIHSCKREEVEKQIPPALSEVAVSDIAIFTAKLSASITEAGNQPISGHGFVISRTNDQPTTDTDSTINKGSIDPATPLPIEISTSLTGLKNSTSYYVRVFALLPSGAIYSPTQTFKTADIIQPGITTDTATNVTHNAARLSGTVRSKGTYDIREYGMVWATTANPTTAVTTKRAITGNVTAFPRAFTADVTSLSLNTTYNFRSYVISNGVTTYGANKTFKTPEAVQPGIRTDGSSNINVNSARLSGTVLNAGTFPVSEHGIVWGTATNPTISQNKVSAGTTVSNYPRSYNVNINGLNKTTTYHFRAYVTSNGVTSYGANNTFTTPDVVQPGIRTDGSGNVGVSSARLSGTVLSAGSYPVSEHGIVWGTAANPTTAQNKVSAGTTVSSYPRSYNVDINGLNKTTTYHFRAYVISNGVTSYGANNTFTTPDVVQPGIRTDGSGNVGVNSARLSGTVLSAGSFPVSEHGIVWGTAANPTISQNKVSAGSSVSSYPRSYNVDINGLNKTTTYHFRAYVTSNGVTSYGANQSFTTPDVVQPGIRTDGSGNVGVNSARLSGTVLSAGSFPVSEHGIVWGTAANPTTAQNRQSAGGSVANYPRSYNVDINGLNKTTTYHFRAYVISNGATSYGANHTFTTADERPPKISTEGPANVSTNSARLRGTVHDGGTYGLSEIGVCWGKNSNPTTSNSKTSKGGGVSIPHDYSFDVSGLDPGSEYHVRAYVISNGVTYYGGDIAFKTQVLTTNPSVVTVGSSRTRTTVTMAGRITEKGSYSLREHGIVYSSTVKIPAVENSSKLSATTPNTAPLPYDYTRSVNLTISSTLYFYRAYVMTSDGQVFYGEVMNFTH